MRGGSNDGGMGAIERAEPLGRQAATVIRRAILNGIYAPGQRLSEQALASDLGLSRSPVHEGLRTLIEEGLLQSEPGRGCRVTQFPLWQVEELLRVRCVLDTSAAEWAAQRATPADVERLEQSLNAAIVEGDVGADGMDFHVLVYDVAGNSKLRELGRLIHRQLRLARLRSGHVGIRHEEANAEHRRILQAIADHDPQRAAECTQQHHAVAREHILRVLAEADDD